MTKHSKKTSIPSNSPQWGMKILRQLSLEDKIGQMIMPAIQGSDFNNLDFSTPYSSQISTWSTSGYNDIALNVTALKEMADEDDFIIAVIEHDYDYSDSGPPGATQTSETGVYFTDESGTDKDPYIEYSNIGDLLGTDFTTISTVSGVAVANIGKVIGVE